MQDVRPNAMYLAAVPVLHRVLREDLEILVIPVRKEY